MSYKSCPLFNSSLLYNIYLQRPRSTFDDEDKDLNRSTGESAAANMVDADPWIRRCRVSLRESLHRLL